MRQIAQQSGKPEHFVRQDIQSRLDANKITCIDILYERTHYLMIDGYLLPGGKILLVYYAYDIEKVVWFSIAEQERKEPIVHDLKILKYSFGYTGIIAFVNDGGPSILSAIREVYPEAIIQRCLVHIQRQVFNYISRHPKSEAGKALVQIMCYAVLSDPEVFPRVFESWKKQYFLFLIEKSVSRKGGLIFTHTSLRKAMRHIENALPNMYQFHNHANPKIERSTNKLEGYFGVFTNEGINEHKGFSSKRLHSFVALWIYFRNQK